MSENLQPAKGSSAAAAQPTPPSSAPGGTATQERVLVPGGAPMKVLLLLYYVAVLAICAGVASSATTRVTPSPEPPAGSGPQRPDAAPPVAGADPAPATTASAGTAGSPRTARVIPAPVASQGGTVEPASTSTTALGAAKPDRSSAPPGGQPRAPDDRVLLLVVLAGALGGVLHGLTSLAAHSGAGRLDARWWVFYVARPVVGGGLALLVALVLRAGLLGFSVTEDMTGDRVLLGWGALAGLFSSPALRKLKDVFDGFGPKKNPAKPAKEGA